MLALVLTLLTTSAPRVVHIEARRFSYSPARIELVKGEPVVLELVSLDREHGFDVPALGLNATIKPGEPTRIPFTPDRAGTFLFHCDVFCGSGHEEMEGQIVVVEPAEPPADAGGAPTRAGP